MALTLADRRHTLADTYSRLMTIIDELNNEPTDLHYVRDELETVRSRLETIDRDGPTPPSIATKIVEAVESISRDSEGDEHTLTDLTQNAIEQAVHVDMVDAIPGVYSYPAKILRFADGSQCFVPQKGQPASEPLYGLVENYELAAGALPGVPLPHVLDPAAVLSPGQAKRLREVRSHTYAGNTGATYASQWRVWVAYAQKRGIPLLSPPASRISDWLTHRADVDGSRPSTIALGLHALKIVHQDCGVEHACDDSRVQATLDGIKRIYGMAPDQVKGVTPPDIAQIEATAHRRRIGRWGKRETTESARRRGDVDIAIVRCLFDMLLRRSELTALCWRDLTVHDDGSGTIHLKQAKTDRFGFGKDLYVPNATVTALLRIRGEANDEDRIFAMASRTVARRVQAAAKAAGLEGHYAGHSGRVGMAQTLATDGAESPEIMEGGRWTSEATVARYIRNAQVSRRRTDTRDEEVDHE